MSANKKSELNDKEKLLVAIADNIIMDDCPVSKSDGFFKRFSPEGELTGILLSTTYKPFIEKNFFGENKYYILTFADGVTDFKTTRGTTEWCTNVALFKNEIDFYNYIDFLKMVIEKKGNTRVIFEDF